MNFPIDKPINNDSKLVNMGENKQIIDEFNKIGTFIIDLSFIQIDNSLNKLVINLTSSNTTQGTTFFVPRYTQSIKNFLNYTEFDDKNKPLPIIDIQKKQLELVTNRSSLEKYMDKYKSKFELSKEQIDMIKKEGDIKVGIFSILFFSKIFLPTYFLIQGNTSLHIIFISFCLNCEFFNENKFFLHKLAFILFFSTATIFFAP